MSGLTVESLASFNLSSWVPVTVLLASLAGSGHCVAMCGGLIIASAPNRAAQVHYHLGRLLGYLLLGAAAGLTGSAVLGDSSMAFPWLDVLSWSAAALMAASFFLAGAALWKGRALHLPKIPARLLSRLYAGARGSAFLTGSLSALLPCGWLHSFVVGALATRSAFLGACFLLIFWLGTLPALGLAPLLFTRAFRPFAFRAPKIAAILLITAGVLSLGVKMKPFFLPSNNGLTGPSDGSKTRHCH